MTLIAPQCSLHDEFALKDGMHFGYKMFDRNGGSGGGLFFSNNVGLLVGDTTGTVLANRSRVKKQLNLTSLLSAKQVHGTEVYCLTEPLEVDQEVEGYDALVTDLPEVGLMIQQADCQAVLLFDPVKKVIAAIHCGWRGSVQNILALTVAAMVSRYGTKPENLQARISASLGPCCAEFVNYNDELPVEYQDFMVKDNHFDFWKISAAQLQNAGLNSSRIHAVSLCTCCSDNYFSYRQAVRKSNGVTGRNCSVTYLKSS